MHHETYYDHYVTSMSDDTAPDTLLNRRVLRAAINEARDVDNTGDEVIPRTVEEVLARWAHHWPEPLTWREDAIKFYEDNKIDILKLDLEAWAEGHPDQAAALIRGEDQGKEALAVYAYQWAAFLLYRYLLN